MIGDGSGWVVSATGQGLWGRYGAAGLLLAAPAPDGGRAILLQRRALWSHHGGTWGIPGGARDSHESATDAALREAREETGLDARQIVVRGSVVTAQTPTAHGGIWTYTTVIAGADTLPALVAGAESAELGWVPVSQVSELALHPGLAASWPTLYALVATHHQRDSHNK